MFTGIIHEARISSNLKAKKKNNLQSQEQSEGEELIFFRFFSTESENKRES